MGPLWVLSVFIYRTYHIGIAIGWCITHMIMLAGLVLAYSGHNVFYHTGLFAITNVVYRHQTILPLKKKKLVDACPKKKKKLVV